ncbi:uncharacterized protein LOC121378659 [Gigantopelta aegis]|uniref:uncharacterized protein LOC121378659 n=1 Tax=Gigantopelta aegis TaxID=1735272 RepID=UPI001B889A9C|nr:uncharacterized protein LOC121378659 [Gigantopelta aegis]
MRTLFIVLALVAIVSFARAKPSKYGRKDDDEKNLFYDDFWSKRYIEDDSYSDTKYSPKLDTKWQADVKPKPPKQSKNEKKTKIQKDVDVQKQAETERKENVKSREFLHKENDLGKKAATVFSKHGDDTEFAQKSLKVEPSLNDRIYDYAEKLQQENKPWDFSKFDDDDFQDQDYKEIDDEIAQQEAKKSGENAALPDKFNSFDHSDEKNSVKKSYGDDMLVPDTSSSSSSKKEAVVEEVHPIVFDDSPAKSDKHHSVKKNLYNSEYLKEYAKTKPDLKTSPNPPPPGLGNEHSMMVTPSGKKQKMSKKEPVYLESIPLEKCSEDFDCRMGRLCHKGTCVCLDNSGCRGHYKPVCGSDGQWYPSHCELHRTACVRRDHIKIDHRDTCLNSQDKSAHEKDVDNIPVDPLLKIDTALPHAAFPANLKNSAEIHDDSKADSDINTPEKKTDDKENKWDKLKTSKPEKKNHFVDMKMSDNSFAEYLKDSDEKEKKCDEQEYRRFKEILLKYHCSRFAEKDCNTQTHDKRDYLATLMFSIYDMNLDYYIDMKEAAAMERKEREQRDWSVCGIMDIIRHADQDPVDNKLSVSEFVSAFNLEGISHLMTVVVKEELLPTLATVGNGLELKCGLADGKNIIWKRNGVDIKELTTEELQVFEDGALYFSNERMLSVFIHRCLRTGLCISVFEDGALYFSNERMLSVFIHRCLRTGLCISVFEDGALYFSNERMLSVFIHRCLRTGLCISVMNECCLFFHPQVFEDGALYFSNERMLSVFIHRCLRTGLCISVFEDGALYFSNERMLSVCLRTGLCISVMNECCLFLSQVFEDGALYFSNERMLSVFIHRCLRTGLCISVFEDGALYLSNERMLSVFIHRCLRTGLCISVFEDGVFLCICFYPQVFEDGALYFSNERMGLFLPQGQRGSCDKYILSKSTVSLVIIITSVVRQVHSLKVHSESCHNYNFSVQQVHSLKVHMPPIVQVSPTSQMRVSKSDITIKCHAEGIPTPKITWQVNEVRIPDFPQHFIKTHANGTLTVHNADFHRDTGAYKCIGENQAGVAEGVASVFIQDPDNKKQSYPSYHKSFGTFLVFHDKGYTAYDPNSCLIRRDATGDFGSFKFIPDNMDGPLKLCDPDIGCQWGSAVNVNNQFVYVSQPKENRIIIIESTHKWNPIQVIDTDKSPVNLHYVAHLDQVWVLCWNGDKDGSTKTVVVIRDASKYIQHHSVHTQPVGNRFDLVQDLFLPPSNDLHHEFNYGYVTHSGQEELFKLDLRTMKYINTIDISKYDCVPKTLTFIPIGGHVLLQCVSPETHISHQLLLDYVTDAVVRMIPTPGKPYVSPDSRHVVTVDGESGKVFVSIVSEQGSLESAFELTVSTNIGDVTFFPSTTTKGYDLVLTSADNNDIIFLILTNGKVEKVKGTKDFGDGTSWKPSPVMRKIASGNIFSDYLMTPLQSSVRIIDGKHHRLHCEFSGPHNSHVVLFIEN